MNQCNTNMEGKCDPLSAVLSREMDSECERRKAQDWAEESRQHAEAAADSALAAKTSENSAAILAQMAAASEKAAAASEKSAADAAADCGNAAAAARKNADASASSAARAEEAAKNAQSIAQGQKGYYDTPEALREKVPAGEDGDWAIVGTTDTVWIWDSTDKSWEDSGQNIDLSNYYQKTEVDTALAKKQDKLTLPLPSSQGGTGADNNSNLTSYAVDNNIIFGMETKLNGVFEWFKLQIAGITTGNTSDRPSVLIITKKVNGNPLAQMVYTNFNKPTPADIGAQPALLNNAGAHNSIYRGKDITDKFTNKSLFTNIANGTFEDLYIGDYFDITISTDFMANEKVRCLLAGFDMFWGCGDQALNKHHAVIVPMNCFAVTAKMNESNDTTGAYTGSDMFKNTLPKYADALRSVFGDNLITNRELMSNAVTKDIPSMAGMGWTGASNASDWFDCELRLMSEVEVYGSTVFSSSGWDIGTAKTQLPLFKLAPNHIVCGPGGSIYASTIARGTWYLSAVASSANFAVVGLYGNAGYSGASGPLCVRPRWLIG